MNLQLFTKWYAKYVLFALCCIILLVVPLLKGPWIGSEPFLFSRLAEDPSWYDPLSNGGSFAAYSWGTALALSLAPDVLVQILPFLLGILSFLLVQKILQHFNQDSLFIHLSLLLFILSPTFIYTFSFTNNLFIAFFLSLAAFYLFIQKKTKLWSIPILIILPLFNISLSFSLLLVLFFYSFFWKKDRKKLFLLLLLVSAVTSSLYYGYIMYHTGLPQNLSFESQESFILFQKIFFDFGSSYGLGIFITLLSILGIAQLWDHKYTNIFLFFSLSSLFLFSLIQQEGLLFLSLFLIFFAAKGFISLMSVHWQNMQYKNIITLIILSGLVFSCISQLNELVDAQPQEEILEGLQFLSEQEPGVVFTHYSRGVWINAAGHTNVLDENSIFLKEAQMRYDDSNSMFYSRDFEDTTTLFEKYDIHYVWIDTEMKEELWEYDTEGLLFILQYTKDFERIYSKNGVEIWSVG